MIVNIFLGRSIAFDEFYEPYIYIYSIGYRKVKVSIQIQI